MNDAQIDENHKENIREHRAQAYHPGMEESVAEPLVDLGRVYGSERCGNGQSQKQIADKHGHSSRPPAVAWYMSIRTREVVRLEILIMEKGGVQVKRSPAGRVNYAILMLATSITKGNFRHERSYQTPFEKRLFMGHSPHASDLAVDCLFFDEIEVRKKR